MTTKIAEKLATGPKVEETFLERHFAKIAFAISTLALLILSPLVLFLATAIGYAISYFLEPKLKLKPEDKIVTVPNTLFAIVGAAAALLQLTPVGSTGGYIFHAIPFVSSLAIGNTAYRALR
jgi:hypothetical protein